MPPNDLLWQRTLAVNATGSWHAATEVLPGMLAAGGGDIVLVLSTAALEGFRYTAAYVASKHAGLGLARALHADYSRKQIRVHAICPGFLDTPMTEATIARIVEATELSAVEARAQVAAMNSSGKLIEPEAVAAVIVQRLRDRTQDAEPVVIA